jgi:hypothetical protein
VDEIKDERDKETRRGGPVPGWDMRQWSCSLNVQLYMCVPRSPSSFRSVCGSLPSIFWVLLNCIEQLNNNRLQQGRAGVCLCSPTRDGLSLFFFGLPPQPYVASLAPSPLSQSLFWPLDASPLSKPRATPGSFFSWRKRKAETGPHPPPVPALRHTASQVPFS